VPPACLLGDFECGGYEFPGDGRVLGGHLIDEQVTAGEPAFFIDWEEGEDSDGFVTIAGDEVVGVLLMVQ